MGRRRFARDRHGRFRPGLEAPERDLLRMLPGEVRELVAEDEPAARRLFPVAYTDDDTAQHDYREMMGAQLLEHHRLVLDTLVATVDAPTLDESDLQAWLGALEVLRLLVGTALDVTEDFAGVEPGDPAADQFTVYQYLSMLQDEIVGSLSEAL